MGALDLQMGPATNKEKTKMSACLVACFLHGDMMVGMRVRDRTSMICVFHMRSCSSVTRNVGLLNIESRAQNS